MQLINHKAQSYVSCGAERVSAEGTEPRPEEGWDWLSAYACAEMIMIISFVNFFPQNWISNKAPIYLKIQVSSYLLRDPIWSKIFAHFLRIPAHVRGKKPPNDPLADGLGTAESVLLTWFWQAMVIRGEGAFGFGCHNSYYDDCSILDSIALDLWKLDIFVGAGFPWLLLQPKGRNRQLQEHPSLPPCSAVTLPFPPPLLYTWVCFCVSPKGPCESQRWFPEMKVICWKTFSSWVARQQK